MNLSSAEGEAPKSQEGPTYLVFDIEATCAQDTLLRPQEIVQMAAVLVCAGSFEVLGSFSTFVQPSLNPVLTPFCASLLGITQKEVSESCNFEAALLLLARWMNKFGLYRTRHCTVVTWGNWDLMCMLPAQCDISGCRIPREFRSWFNIKWFVNSAYSIHTNVSCKNVVTEYFRLPWQGREHNALADCTNVATLLRAVVAPGMPIPITCLTVKGRERWRRMQWPFKSRNVEK